MCDDHAPCALESAPKKEKKNDKIDQSFFDTCQISIAVKYAFTAFKHLLIR